MGDGSFGPVCMPTLRLLNIRQGLTLSALLVLLGLQCNFCVNNALWLKVKHNIMVQMILQRQRQKLFWGKCNKRVFTSGICGACQAGWSLSDF